MDLAVLLTLGAATGVLMLIERRGVPVTLNLHFKKDLKRESRWFAQYGQAACTLVVAALIWRLDVLRHSDGRYPALALMLAVLSTSFASMVLKRLVGRVRPEREAAGQFLGPTWRRISSRESFPSSHSACAVAMTVILSHLYPPATPVFWTMAVACALLRYLMDAHWPSDVLGGVLLGYAIGLVVWRAGV